MLPKAATAKAIARNATSARMERPVPGRDGAVVAGADVMTAESGPEAPDLPERVVPVRVEPVVSALDGDERHVGTCRLPVGDRVLRPEPEDGVVGGAHEQSRGTPIDRRRWRPRHRPSTPGSLRRCRAVPPVRGTRGSPAGRSDRSPTRCASWRATSSRRRRRHRVRRPSRRTIRRLRASGRADRSGRDRDSGCRMPRVRARRSRHPGSRPRSGRCRRSGRDPIRRDRAGRARTPRGR